MHVPSLLKHHRHLLGFTQQQVADKLYVSRNTYTQYETGTRKMDTETFFQLVSFLDIDITVKDYLRSDVRMQELSRKHKEWEQKRAEFFESISQNDAKKVAWFIENGMDIEAKNTEDTRAFLYAVQENAYNVVDYLLKKGAIYYIDGETRGIPPLALACILEYTKTVDTLLQNGANPNERTDEKLPCLCVATRMKHQEIFSLLMTYGADINIRFSLPTNFDPNEDHDLVSDYILHVMRENARNQKRDFGDDVKDMLLFIQNNYGTNLDAENTEFLADCLNDFF